MFTFVEYPGVPLENNAAERALRPAVIDRKVSGGTRSAKGSFTKAVLMSLTWRARKGELTTAYLPLLPGRVPTVTRSPIGPT